MTCHSDSTVNGGHRRENNRGAGDILLPSHLSCISKKPTWPSTLKHSTTSVYLLAGSPARVGRPLSSHPTMPFGPKGQVFGRRAHVDYPVDRRDKTYAYGLKETRL
jgi:hypothetical protein